MKVLGHRIHIMFIHFSAALFSLKLAVYFLSYKAGDVSFTNSSYYVMLVGVLLGWLAVLTGFINLILIKGSGVKVKALIHVSANSTAVVYRVFACAFIP